MNNSQGVGVPGNFQNSVPGQDYYTIVPNLSAKAAGQAQPSMPLGGQPVGGPFGKQPGMGGIGQGSQQIPQGYGGQPFGQQAMPTMGGMGQPAMGGMPGGMPGMGQPTMGGMSPMGQPTIGGMGQPAMGGMGQPGMPGMGQPAMGGMGAPMGAPSNSGFIPQMGGMGQSPLGANPSLSPAASGAIPQPSQSGMMPAVGMGQPQGGVPVGGFGSPAASGAVSVPPIGSPAVTGGIGAPIGSGSPQVTGGIGSPLGGQPMGGVQNGMPGGMPAGMPGAQGTMPGGFPGGMPGGMPGAMPGGMPGDAASQDMAMQNGMPGAQVNMPANKTPGLSAVILGVVALIIGLIPFVIDIIGLAAPGLFLENFDLAEGSALGTVFMVLVEVLPVVGIILGVFAIITAGNARKATLPAPNGKATIGRSVGVVGLVLSIVGALISIALALIFVFGVINPSNMGFESPVFFETIFGAETPSSSGQSANTPAPGNTGTNSGNNNDNSGSAGGTSSQPRNETEKAEQDISALASAELDKLQNQDPAIVNFIADRAEKGFYQKTNFTMQECGLSATLYAQSMLTGFSYTIKDAAADIDTGKGIVYTNWKVRSVFDLLRLVEQKILAVNESGAKLTQDQLRSEYKRIYEEALAENTSLAEVSESLEFTYQNGQWVLDESEWKDVLDYEFGLESNVPKDW